MEIGKVTIPGKFILEEGKYPAIIHNGDIYVRALTYSFEKRNAKNRLRELHVKDWKTLKKGEIVTWDVDPKMLEKGDPETFNLPIQNVYQDDDGISHLVFIIPDTTEKYDISQIDNHNIYKLPMEEQ